MSAMNRSQNADMNSTAPYDIVNGMGYGEPFISLNLKYDSAKQLMTS